MNIWKHSLLSAKKFGGEASVYLPIHKFLDSSKLFYYHAKHRMLLHHTFGIEVCIQVFGDYILSQNGQTVLVRDIAAEHIKEDLNNKIPTIQEWWEKNQDLECFVEVLPKVEDQRIEEFILQPLLRSNIKASLIITASDFGVFLINEIICQNF